MLLHTQLLPVNICRLAQRRSADVRSGPSEERRNGRATATSFLTACKVRGAEIPRQAVLSDGRVAWVQ